MGPCTASSCCCQVHSLSWVPVRPPIAAVSIIATLCHVPLSGLLTLLLVSICHRLLYGLPLLLAPPPHCGSKHWFWPRDWPNE
ncbi:unnamed protein product [Staurois parvus]|uniref:Uncharacterized protein n=1 Tax=Staurois parvus TaxID=386267 RepID=A0ABN9BKF4_9NEOB|nr:unnamed protein product [Staurois parvus]